MPFDLAYHDLAALDNRTAGILAKLKAFCWEHGSAPTDPDRLSRLIHEPPEAIPAILEALAGYFSRSTTGALIDPPLRRAAAEQQARSRALAEAGRRGAQRRWTGQLEPPEPSLPGLETPAKPRRKSTASDSHPNGLPNSQAIARPSPIATPMAPPIARPSGDIQDNDLRNRSGEPTAGTCSVGSDRSPKKDLSSTQQINSSPRRGNRLARFDDIWRAAYHGRLLDSSNPRQTGEAAKILTKLCNEHGDDLVDTQLRWYTQQVQARFASVRHFARAFGSWGPTSDGERRDVRRRAGSVLDTASDDPTQIEEE